MPAVAESKLSIEKWYDFFLSPTIDWQQGQNLERQGFFLVNRVILFMVLHKGKNWECFFFFLPPIIYMMLLQEA